MKTLLCLASLFTFVALNAFADAPKNIAITIKDHKFSPDKVEAVAGEKYTLTIKNEDSTAEEFESHDLKREKIVAGGKTIVVPVGPLKAGEYKFFGEFNEKTAQGVLVVK